MTITIPQDLRDRATSAIAWLLISAFVGIAGWWRGRRSATKPRFGIEVSLEDSQRIDVLLYELKRSVGGIRAYFSQFQNGVYYLAGNGQWKKFRLNEVDSPGTPDMRQAFRGAAGMLLSEIPQEIRLALKEGPAFTFVEKLPEGRYRSLCQEGGTHALAVEAIRKGFQPVALVGVDFDSDVREQPKELATAMDRCVKGIESVLAKY